MIIEEAILGGILIAVGVAQLLQRTLTRIVIGVALVGQGANLMLLVSGGPSGAPPLVGTEGPLSDPLPQALALTAIVITFAMLGFLLALAWRAAKLTGEDRVEDDIEDRRIATLREEEEAEAEAAARTPRPSLSADEGRGDRWSGHDELQAEPAEVGAAEPGSPAPGSPEPGSPEPGTPAPGRAAPGRPAPGSPASGPDRGGRR